MYAVCNKNRVLAQMQCRDKEQNYLPGAPLLSMTEVYEGRMQTSVGKHRGNIRF